LSPQVDTSLSGSGGQDSRPVSRPPATPASACSISVANGDRTLKSCVAER